ncbi:MAG: glycosyltransferase family 4 protein [Bacteroidota bacterium]|nr:glycosyltransferase family 4 protein [Bacteroidota bacterium]
MKIAFISTMEVKEWGGSEVLWQQTANHAVKEGHSVLASVKNWPVLDRRILQMQSNGIVLHLRMEDGYKIARTKGLIKRAKKKIFSKFIKTSQAYRWQPVIEFNPDLVIVNCGGLFNIYDLVGLREYVLSRFNYLTLFQHCFEHFYIPDEARKDFRTILEKSKQNIFVAQRNLNNAERMLATGFNNASVIYNPPNLKDRTIVPYHIGEYPEFACVARLESDIKGQDILLQVFSQKAWKGRKWKLNLYGDGYSKKYLLELIGLYGLENHVFLKDEVNDIREVWRENQLLILSSFSEGTPLALTEAMYCGRTAVVTNVGGCSEILGANGFIAEVASVERLGNALENAWINQLSWQMMGQACAERINEIFINEPYLQLWEKCVACYE